MHRHELAGKTSAVADPPEPVLLIGIKLTSVDAAAPAAPLPSASLAPRAEADATQRRKRVLGQRWALVLFGALFVLTLAGLPYYTSDIAERVRSRWHDWLQPTGYIGQSTGILAFLSFIFLWLYPLRRKYRSLAFTGSIGAWLDVHIVFGVATPFLAAIHAGWRFQGLIGLGFLSMLIVALSGIVGRYIYTRIPRSRNGVELSLGEVQARRGQLIARIVGATGIEPGTVESALHNGLDSSRPRGLASSFVALVSADLARFRTVRTLRRSWSETGVKGRVLDRRSLVEAVRLARREIALTQQARLLEATRAVFGFWHVAHRPIAISALVAVLVHVAVTVTLGVTWVW